MINRIVVIIILTAGVSSMMGYIYITFAYFPKLAHSRGVTQTLVGITLASDSIPFVIVSMISPLLIKSRGRKNCLMYSAGLCSLGIFLFALLNFIDSKWWFWSVALISRMIVGSTMSLYLTTWYSYASVMYKENPQKGFGIVQAAIGIGPIVFLVSSSFIYKWFGYFITFSLLSCTLIITLFLILIFVSDIKSDEIDLEQNEELETQKKTLKSSYIFTDPRIISVLLSTFLAMLIIDAPSPLVADRFADFELPEYLKGLTFLFSTIPFTVVSLLLHKVTKSLKIILIIRWAGWVLLMIGFLMIGPSDRAALPDQVWVILLGFVFFGVSYASLIVTSIPLLQKYALEYDTVNEEYDKVANYLSGIFNIAFGLGSFFGPLLSPIIKNLIGYKNFTDLFALLSIISLLTLMLMTLIPRSQLLKSHYVKEGETSINMKASPSIDSGCSQRLLSTRST